MFGLWFRCKDHANGIPSNFTNQRFVRNGITFEFVIIIRLKCLAVHNASRFRESPQANLGLNPSLNFPMCRSTPLIHCQHITSTAQTKHHDNITIMVLVPTTNSQSLSPISIIIPSPYRLNSYRTVERLFLFDIGSLGGLP